MFGYDRIVGYSRPKIKRFFGGFFEVLEGRSKLEGWGLWFA
jgi:hypothetical protein